MFSIFLLNLKSEILLFYLHNATAEKSSLDCMRERFLYLPEAHSPYISLISPMRTPTVLDLEELRSVSSDSHSVMRYATTVLYCQNSGLVVAESSLDLEGHGNGPLVQGLYQTTVPTGSARSHCFNHLSSLYT